MVQQGSVDWGALVGSSITFSVDMLNRISKANVEVVTITVAQAMFTKFNFEANAQKRLHDSISKLKAFSSVSNALWFGFGMKHIVRSLADTEQGACCVAMCACLSVSYNSFIGGQILKALCDSSGVLPEFRPSLSQWAALFDVCAGAVTISQFPQKVEGFTRILISPEMRKSVRLPSAGPPDRIAIALLDLAMISKGELQQVVLSGSIDCAWLGAVAEWLLSLRVEIYDVSGVCVYRSASTSPKTLQPQVILVMGSGCDVQKSLVASLTQSRTHLLPHGRGEFDIHSPWDHNTFLSGRSTWPSILHDTFGTSFDRLLDSKNIAGFVKRLCYKLGNHADLDTTMIRQASDIRSRSIPRRNKALVAFSIDRLPELRNLQKVNDDDILNAQRLVCDCKGCPGDHAPAKDDLCLELISNTIVDFLCILSRLAVDDSVSPSSSGLMWLYMKGRDTLWTENHYWDTMLDIRQDVTSILALFTGCHGSTRIQSGQCSAACRNGVCVYAPSLTDPADSLLEQLQLRVVPGHIQYHCRPYKEINDFKPERPRAGLGFGRFYEMDPDSYWLDYLSEFEQIHGTRPRSQLLVEETLDLHSLNVAIILSQDGLVNRAKQSDYTATAISIGAKELCLSLGRHIKPAPFCFAQTLELSPLWCSSKQSKHWSGSCSLSEMDLWTNKPSIGEPERLVPKSDEWLLISLQYWTLGRTTTLPTDWYFQYIRGSIQLLYGLLISELTVFQDFPRRSCYIVPASTCLYCFSKSTGVQLGVLDLAETWKSHTGMLHLVLKDKISHIMLSPDTLRVDAARESLVAVRSCPSLNANRV